MTTKTVTFCRCLHAQRLHPDELDGACAVRGCSCVEFRPDVAAATKVCTSCGQAKPLDDFYLFRKGDTRRKPTCRDCDNARPRQRGASKIIRTRARHRATAELISRHQREFRDLLDYFTQAATDEAAQLASAPAASQYSGRDTVRLRRGPRREGQQAEDRIDVARCPECIGYHDRGHTCLACGAQPHAHREAS